MNPKKNDKVEQEPKVEKRRGLDPEIQAMARLDRLMHDLPPESVPRVLQWLVDRWSKVEVAPERFTVVESSP